MTNHVVHGLDISKYQGPWDFVKSIEAGIKFSYIRAGGAYKDTKRPFTDYRFRENARHAEDAGMPAGFYWYFVPWSNATEQADYFCDLIHNVKWQLEPVGDFEFDAGLSSQQVTDYIATFAARVYDNLKVWIDCYSRSYWLHDNTADDEIWAFMKLWIARYANVEEPWNPGEAPKLKPPYWDIENVWQYTEEGVAVDYGGLGPPNGDDDVDLNWFHGTESQFLNWIKADVPPPPTSSIVKIDEPKNTVLRDDPKGKIIANVPNGLTLSVVDTFTAADGSLWYDVGGGTWVLADHVIEL